MRQQVSPRRLAVAFAFVLAWAAAVSAQQSVPCVLTQVRACVHLRDDTQLLPDTSAPTRRLPVLFVHGHNAEHADDADFNYQKNWQDPSRLSFKPALELNDNAGLDIEDYYIRFGDQDRSISEDATDISDAIDLILHRHDPDNYAYPHVAGQTTNVKVVIIAYSKGTLSSRLYLKSLLTNLVSMPPARPDFHPVSEFIAIAPPNHGINVAGLGIFTSTANQQMVNGHGVTNCSSTVFPAATGDFIATLNGHPITDTQYVATSPTDPTPRTPADDPHEAPDSRSPTERLTDGILYVTLFADQNRDFVGGDTILAPPNDDCEGRRLAKNLSPDADNLPITAITDDGWQDISSFFGFLNNDQRKAIAVHQNTPHTPLVICKALYAAAHHRSPRAEDCSLPPDATTLPIIPPPDRAAAMLTLDFSNSMALSTGPNATRASVLKDAVELFVALWKAVSVPSDRLGATYFRTDVTRFPTSGDPMPLLSTGGQTIVDDINNNQSPGGWTAMGGGLQRAIEALNGVAADTPIRRVILFTDGMQNVNPMVERNASNQLVITNVPGRRDSNVSPDVSSTNPIILGSSLGVTPQRPQAINIDTIGIGGGQTFVTRLAEIAAATGGHAKATVDVELLRKFFVEELIDALKGFSPQLVDYRHGAIAANGSMEAFAIEDGVHKLVLKTSWKRGDSLDFSVLKDGVEVSSAGHFIKGDFYKIFVIDLPAKGIATRGTWRVRIKGKSGTAYETAAIVDGSAITFDSKVDLKQTAAGEPLDLVIRMTARGKPVSGTTRTFVTLLSPRSTAGDIIARNPPNELPALEPGMSIGERQLLALTQDPKSLALLKGKSSRLVLKATSKGELRARLSTRVPGIYTAFITVKGSDPKLGQFSRTMTMTTVVPFASAYRKMTSILVSRVMDGHVRIVLTPRDANGHFIGPGLASEVSMELENGRMVGGARDLGNGSYELLFEVPSGNDPIARLRIAGKSFFTGKLSALANKGQLKAP